MSEVGQDNAATNAAEITNDTEGHNNDATNHETANTNDQQDTNSQDHPRDSAKHEGGEPSENVPKTDNDGDLQQTIPTKDAENLKDDASHNKSTAEDNSQQSTIEKENIKVNDEGHGLQTDIKEPSAEEPKDKTQSVGTSTSPATETPEVSSTINDEKRRKSTRGSRRPSYQRDRYTSFDGYGYQNYGLAHLPYKSNFEPSEDARRKAEEFFKTLKL